MNTMFFVRLRNTCGQYMRTIVVAAVLCLIFVLPHQSLHDPDIWLHIKTGELIVHQQQLPHQDVFSFTKKGANWVDHEWLFQVFVFSIYSRWQADGLIFISSLLFALIFLLLYFLGLKATNSYLFTLGLLYLTAYASISRFNIRPEIFSTLFFSVFLFLLTGKPGRPLWLLVGLEILWVNLHGYFFLGPLLVLLAICAEFLRRRSNAALPSTQGEPHYSNGDYRRLCIVGIAVLAATIFNPNLFKGAAYPFDIFKQTFFGANRIFFRYIEELGSTFAFRQAFYARNTYLFLLGLAAISLLFSFRKINTLHLLLFGFAVIFSFTRRNVMFSAIIYYCVIVFSAPGLKQRLLANERFTRILSIPRLRGLVYYCAAGIILFVSLRDIRNYLYRYYYDFDSGENKSLVVGINRAQYPIKAVDFLLNNNIRGNIFNDFNSGAYLVGRAYPAVNVFIDGRTELYGQDFFQTYLDILKGNASLFNAAVNKYNIEAVLLRHSGEKYEILKYLIKDKAWKLVFFDDDATVFLKNTPRYREIIRRYAVNLDSYTASPVDLHALGITYVYPWQGLRRLEFLDFLEKDRAVISEAEEIVSMEPRAWRAYHLLGKAYLRMGSYEQSFKNLRLSLLLKSRDCEALVDLARYYQERKDFPRAQKMLKKALRINPRYAPAHHCLGLILLEERHTEAAIISFGKSVRYDKENPRYRFDLAKALLQAAKSDAALLNKARAELMEALELSRNNETLCAEIRAVLQEGCGES